MWTSTRALLVASVLCAAMFLPELNEDVWKVGTGTLLLITFAVHGLCYPRKFDGSAFVAVISSFAFGFWLHFSPNQFGQIIAMIALTFSGSWLVGEFCPEAIALRDDRIFILVKYLTFSFLTLWTLAGDLDVVKPPFLFALSAKYITIGSAAHAMIWLLVLLASFWLSVGVKRVIHLLITWIREGG